MFITLDLNSETPLYQQLREQIISGIASGMLTSGDPLPSVRQLGVDLGINLHTVNKVYSILKQEGFLLVHRQKGVVINQPEAYIHDSNYLDQLKLTLKPKIAEAFLRRVSEETLHQMITDLYKEIKEEPL
jgi:DNA-binding transcriptional regulator YhcF (GntR family)